MNNHIILPKEQIGDFCRRRHIRRLAVFGSVLRFDFNESSDVDILVEFEPEHIPGLFGMAHMERGENILLDSKKLGEEDGYEF